MKRTMHTLQNYFSITLYYFIYGNLKLAIAGHAPASPSGYLDKNLDIPSGMYLVQIINNETSTIRELSVNR